MRKILSRSKNENLHALRALLNEFDLVRLSGAVPAHRDGARAHYRLRDFIRSELQPVT